VCVQVICDGDPRVSEWRGNEADAKTRWAGTRMGLCGVQWSSRCWRQERFAHREERGKQLGSRVANEREEGKVAGRLEQV
jgi:hypothetical protein